MTGKRFILYEHKGNDYILDNPNVHLDFIEMLGDALTSEEIVERLNELHEEKQHLREALKKEYMAMSGNLCDACKHEEEDNTNNWFVGIDYDVKCRKGHEILLDDEEQKCEDFELRIGD